jgi:hypothetical protein
VSGEKHLQKGSDLLFLAQGLYEIPPIATIPAEDDDAARFFISKTLAYDRV